MLDINALIKGKAEAGELFYESKEELVVSFEGWKLKKSEIKERAGYSIRLVKNGRIGFSGTTDPDAINDMVEKAVQSAQIGETLELEFPGPSEKREFDIYDDNVVNLEYSDIVELGRNIVDELSYLIDRFELKMELRKINSPKLEFQNTSGANYSFSSTYFGVGVELFKMEEGDVLILDETVSSTHKDEVFEGVPKIINRLKEKEEMTRDVVKVKADGVPVILSPNSIFSLLIPIFAAVNGKNVAAGSSPLISKLGEKLFDEKLSIVDDGTIPRKNGTTPFDGEGFQKQPITIIDKGVIKNYLLDIVTAKKLGMKPNGSSSRGIFSPPAPSISNIIVGNGDTNLKELLKYFPKAILVDGLLGIGQGNVLSGAFSNPVALAFFVENGEIVGRVKNLAIAGNIYECLKNITAISEEREWKGGVYLLPHILLDNLSITGGE